MDPINWIKPNINSKDICSVLMKNNIEVSDCIQLDGYDDLNFKVLLKDHQCILYSDQSILLQFFFLP